jgi:hypothetical protein
MKYINNVLFNCYIINQQYIIEIINFVLRIFFVCDLLLIFINYKLTMW